MKFYTHLIQLLLSGQTVTKKIFFCFLVFVWFWLNWKDMIMAFWYGELNKTVLFNSTTTTKCVNDVVDNVDDDDILEILIFLFGHFLLSSHSLYIRYSMSILNYNYKRDILEVMKFFFFVSCC